METKNYLKRFMKIEGTWFTFHIDENNVDIELKIRLMNLEVFREISKNNFRKKEKELNWVFLSIDVIDFMLEDFRGIGGEDGLPLDVCIESKVKIANYQLHPSGQRIVDFICEKSLSKLKGNLKFIHE